MITQWCVRGKGIGRQEGRPCEVENVEVDNARNKEKNN